MTGTVCRVNRNVERTFVSIRSSYSSALVSETSAEEYDDLMDTNVRSTFLFTRHTVPVMLQRKQGTILTISSMAGVYGFAGEAVYCATKFAQVGFAQALDKKLRIHGIKVGVICPGGVKTEFAIGRGRTEEGVSKSDNGPKHCLSPRVG